MTTTFYRLSLLAICLGLLSVGPSEARAQVRKVPLSDTTSYTSFLNSNLFCKLDIMKVSSSSNLTSSSGLYTFFPLDDMYYFSQKSGTTTKTQKRYYFNVSLKNLSNIAFGAVDGVSAGSVFANEMLKRAVTSSVSCGIILSPSNTPAEQISLECQNDAAGDDALWGERILLKATGLWLKSVC